LRDSVGKLAPMNWTTKKCLSRRRLANFSASNTMSSQGRSGRLVAVD
jgi:hypothetical protein